MSKTRVLLLITTVVFFASQLMAQQPISIIPEPVNMELTSGSFLIDGSTTVAYSSANTDLKRIANQFSNAVKDISGLSLALNSKDGKKISLNIKELEGLGEEGYELIVTPLSITINANTEAGIFYATQSLLQTLPAIRTNAALQVPCMNIRDYPRFGWRGMHLDVSRHFFSPELIKEYIDLMSLYKMNTFHWHLVDDQGWRIEIKKYPKLTQVGAWRVDKTDQTWREREQAKEGEAATYGGYYTQEQIKEIVAYAKQRNVTIVPEIEMPGHVASAIASYPQLSCTQQPQLPITGGNYTGMSSNYCAGNDEVFNFLEDVLSEVISLFPSSYIHIGGDEVDKDPWKKCERCQARMKAENLKNEEELQSYFIKRIEKYLISKNKKMIGWDEILEGGLAPQAAVMSWRGEAGGIEAAKMNHYVVMTPGSPCYFDHYQGDPATEPLAIGGFNTLKKVYDYEPVPKELNAQQSKFVLGAQANLWTEFVTTAEHVEYMILPRMLALAEVVWSPSASKDWNDFNSRIQKHFTAFEQKGLHYSKGNFKVDIKPASRNGKLYVGLATEVYKGEVYYTEDGTMPTAQSKKYENEISVASSVTLKAVTVVNGKAIALPSEQSFVVHKAIARDVAYTFPISKYYPADGPNTLTDGVRGTSVVGKYWHGISGNDLIATIDLGEEKQAGKIAIGCLQNYRSWIFLPQSVKVEISADGQSYTDAGTVINAISPDEKNVIMKDFTVEFKQQKVKFIRVMAKNIGVCPKGHSGEGKPAWVFADEIVVE